MGQIRSGHTIEGNESLHLGNLLEMIGSQLGSDIPFTVDKFRGETNPLTLIAATGFGLGTNLAAIPSNNCNSAIITGFYTGNSPSNSPVTGTVFLLVIRGHSGTNDVLQMLFGSNGQLFTRIFNQSTMATNTLVWRNILTDRHAGNSIGGMKLNNSANARLIIPVGTNKYTLSP